jgi:hypothetical protein
MGIQLAVPACGPHSNEQQQQLLKMEQWLQVVGDVLF